MRRQRGLVRLIGLAALVGAAFVARPAAAAVTTEQSASILIFPKVIADGVRDTVIQITNTTNSMRFAHCFYVNGAPTIPGNRLEVSFVRAGLRTAFRAIRKWLECAATTPCANR